MVPSDTEMLNWLENKIVWNFYLAIAGNYHGIKIYYSRTNDGSELPESFSVIYQPTIRDAIRQAMFEGIGDS